MSSPPSVPNSYWGSDTFRKDSVGWSSSLKAPDRPRYEAAGPAPGNVLWCSDGWRYVGGGTSAMPSRASCSRSRLRFWYGEDDVARELGQLRVGGGRRREQEESAHRRRRRPRAGSPASHASPALLKILAKQATSLQADKSTRGRSQTPFALTPHSNQCPRT